ncbi:uncharacterized protein [Coffea arabica]|uniref:Zinc finger, CCHC-type n=1 Tax=Coffea arabica TaxID=13443 RepID=A0ABM4WN16_COFAR
MASTIKDLAFNIVKLDHFDEGNFIHWKKQVHFLLVALKLVYVLTTPRPATNDEEEMLDDIRTKQKWDTDDEICRGHILNAMSGGLFYVDHSVTAAKEFWDKLEVRWRSNFLGFQEAKCITDSTMVAKFIALASASKEANRLRNLLDKIPMWPKPISPISIHCDSAAMLAIAYSQAYNDKFRHVGLRYSLVRDLIMNGEIIIDFVRSKENLVDPLTKGLTKEVIFKTSKGMMLKSNA